MASAALAMSDSLGYWKTIGNARRKILMDAHRDEALEEGFTDTEIGQFLAYDRAVGGGLSERRASELALLVLRSISKE